MIRNIIFLLCFYCFFMMPAHADEFSDYKKIMLDGKKIYLSQSDLSVMTVVDDKKGSSTNCKISNFTQDDARQGVGWLTLTNDRKAIIFYSSSRYMMMDELRECKDGRVILHDSPDPDAKINTVVDINFDKKIYLSLVVSDIATNQFEAVVGYFGKDLNLINAPGFFKKNKDGKGFVFPERGQSLISLNGKYIAPLGTLGQCYDIKDSSYGDAFPGVWDIEKRKKVVFKTKLNDMGRLINEEEIDKKCDDLFKGKATLKELGGGLK